MRFEAILTNSLTTVAGAIFSANICCFWFKFRYKCTDYVTKPFSQEELTQVMLRWNSAQLR